MKKKGNLKERICALTLAFLMPFTSVLPHVTLVAVAEDGSVSAEVTFTVKDDTSAAIETAQVTIYEGDNEEALETKPTDANGTVKFQLEDTTEYQFKVTKELYVPKERGLVSDVRVGNDVNITLSPMQDIQITPADSVVVENGKTTALTVADPVKDVEYTWATSDAKIATVDAATGVVTGVAKGRVDITVSGNGKTQTKTLVVKETPAMTVSVTPNKGPGQDDSVVTSVTLDAQLPADADGTVTFYHSSVNDPGNKLGAATVSGGKATWTVSESDSFQLIGTKEFWAEYSGSDITYYFGANVSTTGTYLKKHDLGLQETAVTKHYGDSAFNVPEVDANTIEDRDTTALAYDSDNKKVVTVNSNGELTIVGVGTANISVTIPESQNYTSSTAYYAVTVEKKDLGDVELETFKWQSVNKVYDGTDDIEIQGKLTNTENSGVIGDDTILVKAKAKLATADVGEYSSCKIGDVDITGNDNYSFTIARANDSVTLKDSNKIKVTRRPVYIQIEKKAGDFESTVSYGQSNTEIEKIIKDENQIVFAGTEGKINNDAQEGLLNGDVLNLAEHAGIILNSDTYYVNTTAYPNAIQPKVTKKDAGNYEICVKNDSQYYGRILVTSEAKTDAQIKTMVDVNDDADGVYEEIGTDNIWVRGNGLETLRFSLKDSTFYKQIMVSADGGTNYVEFPNSSGQGLQFTDSTDADKTLNIYLKNKDGGEETRTKDDNTYLVKVDAENPTAAFTGIDAGLFSNPMQVKFEDFKNSDYQVTIEAADSGSGVASFETCIIQTANDASIMNDIIAAQSNTSIWNKHVDLKPATETINSEGNNLVLARIRDNVGNEAIYTSNGLVFETNKPKLTVVVNNGKPIGPVQDDSKVPYTISVTDMDQEISVSSGIDKVEVIVTDNETQVGSSTALDADKKVVDSYTVSSEDIDKIIGTENDDKTTLSYLVKRASFAIDGLLSVNKYHTNKVTIQITAYDKAGNVTSETVENLCLDNVLPEVLVGYDKYDAKSMHYFDSREMTLTYTERNFSEDLLSFDVEVNGEKKTGSADGSRLTLAELNTVTGIQITKVSDTQGDVTDPNEYTDKRAITYKVEFSQDGAYKIIPHIKDTVGNENKEVKYKEPVTSVYDGNELFVIDNKDPEVNISYDSYVDNGYYNSRNMTLIFTERNFDESLLSFELEINGVIKTGSASDKRLTLAQLRDIKELVVGNVSDSEAGIIDENSHTEGRTLTYTIEFKTDGCYKLIPHIEDKAGKTNKGVTYGETASTSNETFYVDNTKPEIHVAYNDEEIGVKNEKFFNKQRSMTITYNERYFLLDKAAFTLSVDGQKKEYTYEELKAAPGSFTVTDIVDDEKDVDAKKHTDKREIKFTISFGKEKEDHDYQIEAALTDMAGNTNNEVKDTGSKVATGKEFTVDMAAPQMSVDYYTVDDSGNKMEDISGKVIGTDEQSRTYKNAVIKAAVSITERNFAATDSFTDEISVTETAKDAAGKTVDSEDQNLLAKAVANWKKETAQTDVYKQIFTFSKEANYTFNMSYEDEAGNKVTLVDGKGNEAGHFFTFDETAPSGEIKQDDGSILDKFLSLITFGFFSKEDGEISLSTNAEDETSPVKISYFKHYPGRDASGKFDALKEEELTAITGWIRLTGTEDNPYDYFKEGQTPKDYTYSIGDNEQIVPYEKIEDKAGNITYLNANGVVCEKQEATVNIDITTEVPETTFDVADEEVVYNGDVSFDISVIDPATKDNGNRDVFSGLSKVEYAVYIGETIGSVKGEKTFASNFREEKCDITDIEIPSSEYNSNDVTIKVRATDNAGNISCMSKALKMDVTKPTVTVSYDKNTASNDKYFNADREMILTYQERNINQEGLTFDFKAGKKEYKAITLEALRKNAKESGIVISEGEDSQKDRENDKTKYDDSRTLTYTLKFTGGDNADMDYEIIPYIEDQASNKNQDKDGNPIINYTGTTANQIFTVDKTAPEIKVDYYLVDGSNLEKLNISTDEINRLYKNKTIRVIATVEERNFSLKDSFSKEYKQVIPHFTWKQDDGSAGSVAGFENTAVNSSKWTSEGIVRTQEFDFESDGDYSFSLEYTDLAGNKLKQQYPKHYFTVDKTAPEAEVVYEVNGKEVSPGEIEENRFYSNEEITATVTLTERNFARENQASKFEKNQMNLTYTAENLDKMAITTENYTESADTRTKWTSEGYVRTQRFTFNVDANYKFALNYKDLAGNDVKYDTHYFTFDKTAPTGRITVKDKGFWEKLFEKVFFFIFTGDEQKASLDSADVTAGVKSMQYYKHIPDVESRHVFNGLTLEELGKIKDWTDGKEVSVEANQQAVIYEKIVDKAGNVTYINMEQGIIADNAKPQAPEIKITIADPSQGIYDKDVPFTIDVTDPTEGETYSGLKSVRYEVMNNGVVTQSGDFNNQLTDPSARVKSIHEERIVYGAQNNSNHVTIKVYVEDYSGNQSEASRDLKIDMTDPEVQITYDLNNPSNGKYYNATRTATVSVRERNFDPDAVDFTITNTDGTMPSISGWSVSPVTGETDDAINTCVVTFAADGDYTITMNCRDRANRSSHYTQVDDFTIDQTVPVISAAFDNNSAANAGYYDKPRTATITVNEHNFNGSEVQAAISASLQSQGISAPGLNGWSTSGDTHTATIYFGTDGDYSFTINYTDLAGNAATAHTQEKFTVDQTKPQIDIFDIVDKSANNGTVAPGVKYSDVNYDAAGVKISIKGPKHSEETIAGSRTPIPNGESIKMADFEYKETVDDVYTLTAQVTDRAGNVDEKSVMFSVNRFGSNFIFGDSTKTFLDKYYSNKEQNLIITEINVDTLTHNGISYGLDGELVNLENGTDYTVKESGNEASWKSYQYTIKAENFEQEGLYNITIDSTDRAKNEVNNKVKEADIEFVIDKTKPTVVITGVENDGQYRTNNRDITINVADNVAMNRLDVSVDGTETKAESYDEKAILKQKGEIPFSLASSSNWQEITAIATDAAGNTADTTEIRVLITSNLLVQFYRNTPLAVGSSVGIAALAAIAVILLSRKKKLKSAA